MKNIIWYICIVVILLGCGCAKQELNQKEDNVSTNITKEESQFVAIEIPKLDIANSEKRNQEITEYIENYLYKFTGYSFELSNVADMPASEQVEKYEYYVEIKSQIVLQEDECVSIVFEGMYNCRTAAHPTHLFFTYNFNPKSGERILYSDKYEIEDTLYEKCMRSVREKYGEEIDWSVWLDETFFMKELSCEETMFCYYTEDVVGISFPVNFALGSHLEIEIPREEFKDLR